MSDATISEIQQLHDISHRDQFLMKLKDQNEAVRSSLILSRFQSPSLDNCLNELLREE